MKKLLISSIFFSALALSQTATRQVTLTITDPNNPPGTMYNYFRAPGACGSNTESTFVKLNDAPTVNKSYVDKSVTLGSYCYRAVATFPGTAPDSEPSNTVQLTFNLMKVTLEGKSETTVSTQ